MPRVPTLERNRVQVQPLQQGRFQAPDMISERAVDKVQSAVSNLNQTRLAYEDEERKKADQIAILEADQKLSALETSMLYDPKTGAMNKRGKDSFSLPDTVLPDFDAKAGEIEQSLTNDYQKLSFRKMLASRRGHVDNQIQRHVSGETKKYDDDVTKNYVANELNAAIENFHDPERIRLSLDRQRGAIMAHADRNGLDSESTKRLIEDTQSKTHKAVIGRIVNSGGIGSAQKYYTEYKHELSGEDRIDVDKALKEGLIQRDSQVASDKIYSKHSDDMQAALSKAREIKDPERRDETVRRLKNLFGDKRASDDESSRVAFETAYNALEANGGNLDAVPKSVYADLEASKKETLKKIADQMRNGTATKTDINVWYGLQQMAGNSATRDKFKSLNLLEYKASLSESDFQQLAKAQSESKKGNDKLLDGIETKQSIVNNALSAAGIEYDKKAGSENIKKANEFRAMVDKLVIQKQDDLGRKVTNEEVRQITNDLMTEVVTDRGWFWDTKKPLYQVPNEQELFVKIQDIPQNEIEKIRAAFSKRGIPVSNDKIVEIYIQKLKEIRAKNG